MQNMDNDPVVIVGAARTPMAGLQRDFASLAASDLGAVATARARPHFRERST
jgi:acetyl-CoA C-acetyltransferase